MTRTFGTIPRGKPKRERGPKESAQGEFCFARSEADIKEGYSVFGWHVPENHADEVTLKWRESRQRPIARFYRAAVAPRVSPETLPT